MFGSINWSRQIIILFFAGIISLYWTSKHGVWDAVMGTTEFDKDWAQAKMILKKKCGIRFEIVDGINQRDEKRVLVLSPRRGSAGPEVLGEMFPVLPRIQTVKGGKAWRDRDPRKRKEKEKEARNTKREKTKDKNSYKRSRPGPAVVVEREPVARLRIYNNTLDFLKEAFLDGKGVKKPDSLIDVPNWEAEEAARKQEGLPPRGVGINALPVLEGQSEQRPHVVSQAAHTQPQESTSDQAPKDEPSKAEPDLVSFAPAESPAAPKQAEAEL